MPRRPAINTRPKSKKRDYKKYIGLIGLFVLSLTFLGFYSFFKQFSKACIFADSENSNEISLHKNSSYSVALITLDESFNSIPVSISSIQVMMVKPNSKGSLLIDIPVETVQDMPGKYGEEAFSSVLALGMMNKTSAEGVCGDDCYREGMNYAASALQLFLGVSIDKWVLVDPKLAEFSENILFKGKPAGFFDRGNISLMGLSMKTNFKFSEFLQHYNVVRSLSLDGIKNITFSTIALDALDNNLRELSYNSSIATEKLSIAILNATKTPGVASYGSRVAKNSGGHVTSVENATLSSAESAIISDYLDSDTALYLADYFKVKELYSKKESPFIDSPIDRADLVLILGLDFLQDY